MSFRQTIVSGFPAIALRSEELEVVVVPTLGMKLTNLRRLRGREWLWRNDQLPLALPKHGASYGETADSGGWDECFPTVAESGRPPRTTASSGAPMDQLVYEHAGGTTLAGTALGRALALRVPSRDHARSGGPGGAGALPPPARGTRSLPLDLVGPSALQRAARKHPRPAVGVAGQAGRGAWPLRPRSR